MIPNFNDPPEENRIRPFWFLNGDIEEEQIKKQILEMKDKGLGGFILCARQGMTVPYLSDEWFLTGRKIVELAKQQGLEVWLYDEFPYPSGMSGGEVTLRHPEACQHELVFRECLTEDEKAVMELGRVTILSAMAYPVTEGRTRWDEGTDIAGSIGIIQPVQIYQRQDKENALNSKRFFSYGPEKELYWRNPGGKWRIIVAAAKKIDSFKYYGEFMDPADPKAVDAFLETTYEKYYQAFGGLMGTVIKGIYADETHFLGDHFWSFQLPDYYRERFGGEIVQELAAVLDREYPGSARIRYQYFQCMHELLRDRYHKRISEWCGEHGIKYMTEIPSMRMSGQMYSHIPGGDPNHDKIGLPLADVIERDFAGFRSNTKIISATARQYDRRDSMIESFHSIGWSMTLQDAKWMIDRETFMGASFHAFHAFFYTVDGITKHDAAPSQFLQNPYWEHYRKLADYCARTSRFITETQSSARTAVFHPITSWWTALINPMLRMKYTGSDAGEEKVARRLIKSYLSLCRTLLFHGIDYDDLDAETLARARIEGNTIKIGRASYNTVLVPPVTNMEGYAGEMLKEFARCKGRVIFCGTLPHEDIDGYCFAKEWKGEELPYVTYIDAPAADGIREWENAVLSAVKEASPFETEVVIPEEARGKAVCCRREDGEFDYVFLTSCDGVGTDFAVSGKDNRRYYELDLETGETVFLKEGGKLEGHVGPWESRLIAAARPGSGLEASKAQAAPAKPHTVLKLPVDKTLKTGICGYNVLRFEKFRFSVQDSPWEDVLPQMWTEQVKDAGLTGWCGLAFRGGFGVPAKMEYRYPVRLRYETKFTALRCPEKAFLMHDKRGIMGEYAIRLNGRQLGRDSFYREFIYDQNNLMCDVSEWIAEGENTLEIEVTAWKDWHGLSDPVYLLGSFGVDRDCVTAEREGGYPYYSGKRWYSMELALPKDAVTLALPENAGCFECVGLQVDGKELGTRAFLPYEWLVPADPERCPVSQITITVDNTLTNMLEGRRYDYTRHLPVSVWDALGEADDREEKQNV